MSPGYVTGSTADQSQRPTGHWRSSSLALRAVCAAGPDECLRHDNGVAVVSDSWAAVQAEAEVESSADPSAERFVVRPGQDSVLRQPMWRLISHGVSLSHANAPTERPAMSLPGQILPSYHEITPTLPTIKHGTSDVVGDGRGSFQRADFCSCPGTGVAHPRTRTCRRRATRRSLRSAPSTLDSGSTTRLAAIAAMTEVGGAATKSGDNYLFGWSSAELSIRRVRSSAGAKSTPAHIRLVGAAGGCR